MRLQRGRTLLPWLFSLVLFVEFPAMASPVYTSIQTPSSLNILEGSTLNISCQFNRNNLSKWYIEWFHNKSGKAVKLQNSRQINITVERDIPLSYLVLEKADIDDSGMYQCCFGASENFELCSNRTNVIIKEITDLMVNQTPADLEKTEGESVTIECYFRTVSNLSTMYVRWRKDMKDLNNQTGSVQIIQDLEKGFTSLTLTNVDKSDSGFYQCEVGSSLRNRSGLGNGSHLVVTGEPEVRKNCPKECPPTAFLSKPVPLNLLQSYENITCRGKTSVILTTKKNRAFCARPEHRWVQTVMRQLDAKNSPPPSESSAPVILSTSCEGKSES